jgi:hypothetical protein
VPGAGAIRSTNRRGKNLKKRFPNLKVAASPPVAIAEVTGETTDEPTPIASVYRKRLP